MEVLVHAGMCGQEVKYSNGCGLLMISVSISVSTRACHSNLCPSARESWVRLPDRECGKAKYCFLQNLVCEVFCTTISRVREKSYHRLF